MSKRRLSKYLALPLFIIQFMILSAGVVRAAVPYPEFSDLMNLDKIRDDLSTIQAFMGGAAVLIAILVGPYAFLLMAKGGPEDIKKGKELLISIVSGLLVILMAGMIVRFVVTDILKLG